MSAVASSSSYYSHQYYQRVARGVLHSRHHRSHRCWRRKRGVCFLLSSSLGGGSTTHSFSMGLTMTAITSFPITFGERRQSLSQTHLVVSTNQRRLFSQERRHLSKSTHKDDTFLQTIQALAKKWKLEKNEGHHDDSKVTDTTYRTAPSLEQESDIASHMQRFCQGYDDLPSVLPLLGDEDDQAHSQKDTTATSASCSRRQILEFLAREQCQTKGMETATTAATKDEERLPDDISKKTDFRDFTFLEFLIQQSPASGLHLMLALRQDLLQLQQEWRKQNKHSGGSSSPETSVGALLRTLDHSLQRVLSAWFQPDALDVKRITMQSTSSAVLEKITEKEAVHPMNSVEELYERLGSDRRVFCLFHPLLEEEPLVFVHVALGDEIPSKLDHVLPPSFQSHDATVAPKVATFYSISNAQAGLVGLGLGEHLLHESIVNLQSEFESLSIFVTLSPIPGFRSWLEEKLLQNVGGGQFQDESLLTRNDRQALVDVDLVSPSSDNEQSSDVGIGLWSDMLHVVQQLHSENTFFRSSLSDSQRAVLRYILMRLVTRYILLEKHRGKPFDAVARFHISNGARVHRLNYDADLSQQGLQRSLGLMINYHYNVDELKQNRLAFEKNSTSKVAATDEVNAWLATDDYTPIKSQL